MTPNLAELGLAAGGAAASGLRLYGTVAALGFLQRIGAVHLPGRLDVLGSTPILVLATFLFVVEFLADKIPVVDTVWDAVHTFIRVPAAAVLGFAALSDVGEPWRTGAALLCGTIAFSAHGLKAGTRVALNASPEPFTNWTASLSEDVLVAGLVWMIVSHPAIALAIGIAFLAAGILFAAWMYRAVKKLFARPRAAACLLAGLLLLLAPGCRSAAAPPPAAAPSPQAPAAAGPDAPLPSAFDRLAGAIEGGDLHVEMDLQAGRVPVASVWAVEVTGSPLVTLEAGAREGKVERFDAKIANGTLVVAGKGLRPKVSIESLRFEGSRGIVDARFKGRGIWRPIVALFRSVAMNAVRKVRWKTDIPSVLRGDVMETTAAPASAPPASASTPAAASPPGPSFLDLLREARLRDSSLRTFRGKALEFGDFVSFRTASGSSGPGPLELTKASGSFQPGRGGAAASYEVTGVLSGAIEEGAVSLAGERSEFSRGKLDAGRFSIHSAADRTEITIRASLLDIELSKGRFRVPGGPMVAVDAPSRIAVRDLFIRPDGAYSGVVSADLVGKVGSIDRAGTAVSASRVSLKAPRLVVADGKATGDVDLEFDYKVDYPLSVAYPIPELAARRVTLVFAGPFSTKLHLQDAGGDSGTVTGEYSFKVPWPPIEQAALEVLRARWKQDAPVIKKVDIDIEPRRFSPCGDTCFLLDLEVKAEKKSGKKSIFSQICQPQGKADLVVDAPTRSFLLKNIRIETRCKGVVGWVVNLLSPLLTKSYTDMVLFKMPDNLPFTIEKVGSGVNWLAIAGRVDYEQGKKAEASTR